VTLSLTEWNYLASRLSVAGETRAAERLGSLVEQAQRQCGATAPIEVPLPEAVRVAVERLGAKA
jgi:hypothetical protein